MDNNNFSGNVQTYEYNYKEEKPNKFASGCMGCFGLILRYLLMFVIGIGVFYGTTAISRWFNENNNAQKAASYSLNTIFENDQTHPIGEYVSLEVQAVFGPYATLTQTRETEYSLSSVVKEKEYYLVLLESGDLLTVATSNADEKQALAQMCEWASTVEDPEALFDGDSLILQGELMIMSEPKLINIYNGVLRDLGLSTRDEGVTMLIVDTDAGRGAGYVLPIVAVIAVIVIIIIISKRRKAKKEEEEAARMRKEAEREENAINL